MLLRRSVLFATVALVSSLGLTVHPAGAREIRIGYFGPSGTGDDLYAAASLAVEHANRADTTAGVVYRLMPCWSENPWGTGVKQVVRLVYEHGVCAFIGGVDGPSTHLVEQVVSKVRLPLINPVSSDTSISLAYVPWVYSCLPAGDLQARALLESIEDRPPGSRIILLSANDHDSHLYSVEVTKQLTRLRRGLAFHFVFDPHGNNLPGVIEHTVEKKPEILILSADAVTCARLVGSIGDRLAGTVILGPAAMASNRFREVAENIPDNIIFPLLYSGSGGHDELDEAYFRRTGCHFDYRSAYMYDAVTLMIDAIRRYGPEPEDLRENLEKLSPWQGITGMVRWDEEGRNQAPVRLGTYRNGQLIPLQP